jgi:hypothetical protein
MLELPAKRSFFLRTFSTRTILLIALLTLAVNLLVAGINSAAGLGYPYNTFLLNPVIRFSDFLQVVDGFGVVDIWGGPHEPFIYYQHTLPFVATIYFASAKLIEFTGNQYTVLFGLFGSIIAAVFFIARRVGNSIFNIALALCSYPVLMCLDRANIAMLVFMLLLLALSSRNVLVSTLCIALAASLKLTPIIFVLPLLLSRTLNAKWITQVLLLVSLWFIGIQAIVIIVNGVALSPHMYDPRILFSATIEYYNKRHIETLEGLPYGSSLYMPLVYISQKLGVLIPATPGGLVVFFSAMLFLILWMSGKIVDTIDRLITQPNMTFALSICFVLFMPVSADYYLVILLLPLLLYPQTQFSLGYALCYGILLGAKNYSYVDLVQGYIPLSPQVFINPLLLIILFFAEFNVFKYVKRETPASNLNPTLMMRVRQFSATYVEPRRRKIVLLSLAISLCFCAVFFVRLKQKEAHNLAAGLPPDFDPEVYLALHPGLEEYWHSVGMFETGQALLDHAEIHYRYFGSKDNWSYRSTFQKILYPKF